MIFHLNISQHNKILHIDQVLDFIVSCVVRIAFKEQKKYEQTIRILMR